MTFQSLVNYLEINNLFKQTSKKKADYRFFDLSDLYANIAVEKGIDYNSICQLALKSLTPYSFTIAKQEIKVTASKKLKTLLFQKIIFSLVPIKNFMY